MRALSFRGEEAEEDLRVAGPPAGAEAMAMGVWGPWFRRAARGGGAGWSEFQRPRGRAARVVSAQTGLEEGPGRSAG